MSSPYILTCPNDAKGYPSQSSVTLAVAGRRSWLTALARASIHSLLQRSVIHGHIRLEEYDRKYDYGNKASSNSVCIQVLNENFWKRVFLTGDLGFGEAYMVEEIHVDNLHGAMQLWLDNQESLSQISSSFDRVLSMLSACSNRVLGQTRSQARLNAMASYDQSNDLFKAFLSQEMMYSCARWGSEEGGIDGDLVSGPSPGDLESAQLRKIHHVLRKARVKPGQKLLEFGSGWGALAIEAARTYGCEVDSLTLSIEQKSLAEERVKAAGLEGKVRIHLMDYRDLPRHFEHAFDAFVSIEMLEHVGSRHYKEYFSLVDFALKPHNATMVVTSSTFPESRYTGYQAKDFMRKYMWPNSCLPSATALVAAAYKGAHGCFTLEGIENHAAHYPRTLRTWDRRLKSNLRQDVIAKAYPALADPTEYAIFKRKWEYFFAYAGEGFSRGYITCHMLTFSRANDAPESLQ